MDATGLIPSLPRRAWIILGGDMVSAVGSGMTMPFFIVYLRRVRGVSLLIAGLALANRAVASFAGNVIGGSLADRFGPRRALMVGLGAGTGGAAWFAFVHSAPTAPLLASVVDDSQRASVFAIRRGTMNAGFGIGAVAAAAIVDLASPRSFELLYLGIGDGTPYFVLLVVGSAAAAIGGFARRRRLPAHLDLVGPSHAEAPALHLEAV